MADIRQMVNGFQFGKLALSGLLPSTQNPRGGSAAADPVAPRLQQLVANLKDCADTLRRQANERSLKDAVTVQEMAVKVERLMIDRQAEYQRAASTSSPDSMSTNYPNINAGGIV